jgi:hypothetical protein
VVLPNRTVQAIKTRYAGNSVIWENGRRFSVSFDDPIAEKILSDSPYERLRARQLSYFVQPIDRKIAWQSYLLFTLAGLLPVLAVLPSNLRQTYLPSVAASSPKLAFVALVAVVFVSSTGVGHALVEYARITRGPLDERQARELVTFESLCSMLGFGTGGLATFSTYALVLLGFGGRDLLQAFLAAGGGNPFEPSSLGVTVAFVAIVALLSAVALQTLSAYLHVRAALADGA